MQNGAKTNQILKSTSHQLCIPVCEKCCANTVIKENLIKTRYLSLQPKGDWPKDSTPKLTFKIGEMYSWSSELFFIPKEVLFE